MTGDAAFHGAATGALPGVLAGWIFGAVVGALLVADEDVADEAVRLVAGLDSRAGTNTESASSGGRRPRNHPVPG
ncbi:hypothetical protein ACWCYL_18060 [Streptomyces sp. 900105755]|uniref:hypothetical protein n=1 Tax=Streptomyces sp. 900105755 TaxID=3154389 RepID=UPI003328033B